MVGRLTPRCTITNDDSATLTLAGVAATQNEGTGGTTTDFTFSVTLSSAVQGGFGIAYATSDGTATVANSDYADNDGSLSFTGTTNESKTITVQVNHDAVVEADETFTVALGAISGLATGVDSGDISTAGSPQTGTITNDDTAPTFNAAESTPADDATGVAVDVSPQLDFSKNIAFGTGNITLYKVTGGSTTIEEFNVATEQGTGNGQVSISGDKLTINPTSNLDHAIEYAIQIATLTIPPETASQESLITQLTVSPPTPRRLSAVILQSAPSKMRIKPSLLVTSTSATLTAIR